MRSSSEIRRDEILEGASGALRKLGLHRAGMREIASEVGISAGNLYYYFRSKDELVYAVQDRSLDRLLAVARTAAQKRGTRAQLEHLVHGHLQVVLGEGGSAHLDFEGLPAPLLRKITQKRDRYERAVRELVERGRRRGEVRSCDPKLATFALLGALNWAARWWRPGGHLDPAAVAASFSPLLLDGLLKERP